MEVTFLTEQKLQGLMKSNALAYVKANIGFVFQNFNLIDELTVYENVELPLIYNKIKASERKERVT